MQANRMENFLHTQIILLVVFSPSKWQEVQMTAHTAALVQVMAQPYKDTTDNSRCPLVTAPRRGL